MNLLITFLTLMGCAPFETTNREWITADGFQREYWVHVPEYIKNSSNPGLVVMLHGTSGNGLKFYNISGWAEKADRLKTIKMS